MVLLSRLVPWQPVFAVQQWFSANPAAGREVSLVFDPTSSRQTAATDAAHSGNQFLTADPDARENKFAATSDIESLSLPLRISGVPVGLILHVDRSTLRLIDSEGKTLYSGVGRAFDLPSPDDGDSQAQIFQTLPIPAVIARQAADRTLRLEIDYSLTLMRPRRQAGLPALGSDQPLPNIGRCSSAVGKRSPELVVDCRTTGELPPCMSLFLERTNGTARNPEKFICDLNYEPQDLRFSMDPIDSTRIDLPLRDPNPAAHCPIDETQLHDAQVAITLYAPEDHFRRSLVVAEFRVRDFQAAPPVAGDKVARD